jgi:hypothetical protein
MMIFLDKTLFFFLIFNRFPSFQSSFALCALRFAGSNSNAPNKSYRNLVQRYYYLLFLFLCIVSSWHGLCYQAARVTVITVNGLIRSFDFKLQAYDIPTTGALYLYIYIYNIKLTITTATNTNTISIILILYRYYYYTNTRYSG